jgi:hypothetical protein
MKLKIREDRSRCVANGLHERRIFSSSCNWSAGADRRHSVLKPLFSMAAPTSAHSVGRIAGIGSPTNSPAQWPVTAVLPTLPERLSNEAGQRSGGRCCNSVPDPLRSLALSEAVVRNVAESSATPLHCSP